MKEKEIQASPGNGLIFSPPESLQKSAHILEYEQKNITKMVREYAFWGISKQLAFGFRRILNNKENERTKYYYYLQQALRFEDKLNRSIFLRTRQLPFGKKGDYILWATATAIYAMHKDDSILHSFPDEAFMNSRRSLSRKLIQNSRRAVYMEDDKVLSQEWMNQLAIKLYDPPLEENGRVFDIANALDEYVHNPVYNPDEIVFAEDGNSKRR